MSTKPMKPIKQPQQQINLEDTESLVCDECGNCGKVPDKMMPNNDS